MRVPLERKKTKTRKVAPKRPRRAKAKKPQLRLAGARVKNAKVKTRGGTEKGSVSFRVMGDGKEKPGRKTGVFMVGKRSFQATRRPHGLTWNQAHRLEASKVEYKNLNSGFISALSKLSKAA